MNIQRSAPPLTRAAYEKTQDEIARFGRYVHDALIELGTTGGAVDADAVARAVLLAGERIVRPSVIEGPANVQTKFSAPAA